MNESHKEGEESLEFLKARKSRADVFAVSWLAKSWILKGLQNGKGFLDPVATFQEPRAQIKLNIVTSHFYLRQGIVLGAE